MPQFSLPPEFVTNTASSTTGTISGLAPIIELVFGVLLALIVIGALIASTRPK